MIGKTSIYRKVFDGFLENKFVLCVSPEILFEYEEKFNKFWGDEVTHNLMGVLLTADNTQLQSVYYNFNLVSSDADDNKFSDTYLASSADLLVNKNEFPSIRAITLQDFLDSHLS
jgi:putative PIN family toxin of toxin-antitoxin system